MLWPGRYGFKQDECPSINMVTISRPAKSFFPGETGGFMRIHGQWMLLVQEKGWCQKPGQNTRNINRDKILLEISEPRVEENPVFNPTQLII